VIHRVVMVRGNLRAFLENGPFLGSLYLLWQQHRMMSVHPHLVCRKGVTRICIEGAPRSANTFAVRLFRVANDVHVAHHTHSVLNVRRALRYGLPVLILIRDPLEAIASSCVYHDRGPEGVDREVTAWLLFYRYVERVRERVVVADFETVVGDFNSVIEAVNRKFGTRFHLVEDVEAARQRVFEDIRAYSAKIGEKSGQVPMPTAERGWAKAYYRALLLQHPRLRAAQELYDRLTLQSH